jgi:propionyl-CoA synthetase
MTMLESDEKFVEKYMSKFPGYYQTFDIGKIDEDGYVHILSRNDDTINVQNRNLSSSYFEDATMSYPEVIECAVVAKSHPDFS